MAHQIVWASVATVDRKDRPRSRVLHPIWQWDGEQLTGWIATGPTPLKRAHLDRSPHVSVNYWQASQDTCVAECLARWHFDLDTRERIWALFERTPPPVGYDPAIIPGWEKPSDDAFAVLELEPWRLRVFPGSVLLGQGGEVLTWQQDAA
jgi:hypothetical protein